MKGISAVVVGVWRIGNGGACVNAYASMGRVVVEVTLMLSPSGSESLSSTGMVTAVSSSVDVLSSWATGGSLTGLTVTYTVAESGFSATVCDGVGERILAVVVGVRRIGNWCRLR